MSAAATLREIARRPLTGEDLDGSDHEVSDLSGYFEVAAQELARGMGLVGAGGR